MTETTFWDRVADRYAARPLGNPEAYEATLERVRHWLPPRASVLELGCGTGSTALRLAADAGAILGTDLSAEMLRIARGRATEAGAAHVTFEQAAADRAGAGQTFEAVLAFNLLHLLPDRAAALRHVRGILPAGGLFISKTPCLSSKQWLRPVILALRCFGKAPPGIRYLSPAQVEAEIAAAGFEIVETGDYPKSLPNHFVVARVI
ncbi:class I SAM-dependent methyltransferase [Thetidibacter halocola]|uniref:Class I SAM-dependent methyltransferase n=1 Tax=Thetidibacter halocola TaxID=2827239 RepID=A0A8J7WF00_9RHOB|nr:class I SAM-dependent methyltransferase [Thetidibacter halocola]MBS0126415.1 class I SAM-dependent methyltransferase [Thetidibacter halocola]